MEKSMTFKNSAEKNGKIVLVGQSRKSFPPDTIRIHVAIVARNKSYEDTLNSAADSFNTLVDSLKEAGFEKKDIKTNNFTVNSEYSYERDTNNRIFVGFICNHNLFFDFPKDSKKFNQIITKITTSESNPEFNIEYRKEYSSDIKKDLLKEAFNDAETKAEILAEAAGKTLSRPLIIKPYESTNIGVVQPLFLGAADGFRSKRNISIDIEPEELTFSETLQVTWEIV